MPFSKVASQKGECRELSEDDIKKLLEERTRRRQVLRDEFLKQKSDPFRHASEEGGTVFDAAIQRYHSMRGSFFDHFRPTFANACKGVFLMVVPMVSYCYLVHTSREEREKRFRSGLVAYKDRRTKYV